MFHLGFSYTGLLYLLMLYIPNIIWTKYKPKGYEAYVKDRTTINFSLMEKNSFMAFVI